MRWGGTTRRVRAWTADHAVLLAIVAGGALLRLRGLGRQSLWYDEWLTAEGTSGGLGDLLLRHVPRREGHPPTYFVLTWLWVHLFGDGDAALRTVSALAGIAIIPLAYLVVRELLPHRHRLAAWVAALLVAVNPMLVWYSQEARPYSLLALASAASVLACVRLWRRGQRSDVVFWALACAATVAVHWFAVFVVAAEALALLLAHRFRDPAIRDPAVQDAALQNPAVQDPGQLVAAGAASAPEAAASPVSPTEAALSAGVERPAGDDVPEAPTGGGPSVRDVLLALVPSGVVLVLLAPFAVRQHANEAGRLWISDFSLSHRMGEAGRAAFLGPSPPDERLWLIGAAVVALAAVVVLWRADREERAGVALLAGIGAVAVVLPLVATVVGVDVVLSRYLIASLLPLTVAVAVGLTLPRARAVGLAGVAVLGALSLVAVVAVAREPDLQRAEWRHVADVVGPGQGDRVLVLSAHGGLGSPLHHYLDGSRRLDDGDAVTVEGVDVLVANPSDAPCNLLVGRACGMIFLGAPPSERLTARGLTLDERVELDQFTVDRYRFPRPTRVTHADLLTTADPTTALALLIPDR